MLIHKMKRQTKLYLAEPLIRLGTHKAIMISAFVCSIAMLTLLGCTKPSTEELDQALALYRQNQLNEALPLFEQAVAMPG
jgi:hypothetical protein